MTFDVWGRGRWFRTLQWRWGRALLELSVGLTIFSFGLSLETPVRDGRWRMAVAFGPAIVSLFVYPRPKPDVESTDPWDDEAEGNADAA